MEVIVLLALVESLALSFLLVLDVAMRKLSQALVKLSVVSSFLPLFSNAAPPSSSSHLPPGFPQSGNGLFYTSPANLTLWSKEWLPIGNGYLAATLPGGTIQDTVQVNIESLWSGGPFFDPEYNGGNKLASQQAMLANDMQTIRQAIFNSPNGTIENVDQLETDPINYGSYASAGFLVSSVSFPSSSQAKTSGYSRVLNIDNGVGTTAWTSTSSNGQALTFTREAFCSNPAKACVQRTLGTPASGTKTSFTQTYALTPVDGVPAPNVTCLDDSTISMRGLVSDPGMLYEVIARVGIVNATSSSTVKCQDATITVSNATGSFVIWTGGTNFDPSAGDEAHGFTFRGADPHEELVQTISSASSNSYDVLFSAHEADFSSALSGSAGFSLDIGQKTSPSFPSSTITPTSTLVASYVTDVGDRYVEWLTFNYARYMLVSSARGILPANLQGKWGNGAGQAWGADYHANINLQMNYWAAESTGLGDVTASLWGYIQTNWAPRGAYTAKVLYNNSRGWVTHDEMNIFGHTGMKSFDGGNSAQWADYTASAVWMMIHAWDHFDYTQDQTWWNEQGWPLLKGVAEFHLDNLKPDEHFKDGSLVVVPCNSPEQVPITFGCAHAQQIVWQLFNAVEKGAPEGEEDFVKEVVATREQMDKGIHIGSWGQLQEWKFDMDSPTDTHRHLSHLIGLYPGYAVASYNPSVQIQPSANSSTKTNYSQADVWGAAKTSLIHRGNGTGPDADSGWEKVWRAACWAQLGNSSMFWNELSYAINRNFAPNLFSMYDPADENPIFQIDANFGYAGALMNGLLQAPDVPSLNTPLLITLLPALPSTWPTGSITGARVRGGISVDFNWDGGKLKKATFKVDKGAKARPVQVIYAGKQKASWTTSGGSSRTLTF